MRDLRVTSPDDSLQLMNELRSALSGDGPALLPRSSYAGGGGALPDTVAQNVAVVVETSGSTSTPKRVALSADALLASAGATESAIGAGQWLLALPVHYIAGLQVLVRSIAADTVPTVLPAGHFETGSFLAAAATMDATLRFTSLVPTQLTRLIDDAEADADQLRVLRRFDRILLGGQAAPAGLMDRALALDLAVTRTYGSSETSGGCVYDGVPIGQTRLEIVDGELEVSGPMLAEGYLEDPALTSERFRDRDGHRWYRTGDAARLVDGVLTVTGRLDDSIISGGMKVSLADVDRVLQTLPGLPSALAFGLDDAQWGQTVVVVADGRPRMVRMSLDELRSAVTAELGPAAAPSRLEFLPTGIPQTASGKPDRQAILRLLESPAP